MKPYYADDTVTLHHGDCLDVLRTLPDSSVDAVVTDPPYGLEFMGKDWDSFKAPTGGAGFESDGMGKGFTALPNFGGNPNPTCRNCRGMKRGQDRPGFTRCRCDAPDFPNVGLKQSRAFGQWCEQWAVECLRVLKPGGHLLAFGGTRTAHRLTCAIEDAGFEIRDGIDWLYASGFPKSLDVSKSIDKAAGAVREVVGQRSTHLERPITTAWDRSRQAYDGLPSLAPNDAGRLVADVTAPATDEAARWSGWGTALKPAREPIVMARKPLAGTVAGNVLAYGTGALNIDATRVPGRERTDYGLAKATRTHGSTYGSPSASADFDSSKGRWPSNVVLSHAPDCGEQTFRIEPTSLNGAAGDSGFCAPGCPVAELDRQSGTSQDTAHSRGTRHGAVYGNGAGPSGPDGVRGYTGSGGASRFFPVFRYEAKAPTAERPRTADGTAHPTVKPLDLMRWLVRLVTPAGGVVLEPFAGSGTTAEACVLEGFRCIAIEREAAYLPLIVARLSKPLQPALDFGDAA